MNHQISSTRLLLVLAAFCGSLVFGGALNSASAQNSERDPFRKYKPPAVRVKQAKAVTLVTPPSIQQRIEAYKAQKRAAMTAQQPAPKATTALLLNELQVMGIFRTPRGYAAMVEATPIKLAYVIYPGETFYDGQLVAIEENRLVFRHESRWSNGRRETSVETKPLRQPDAVTDSLATAKNGNAAQANSAGASADRSAPTDKPAPGDKPAPTPQP